MVTSSSGASTSDVGGLTYADIVDLAEQAPLVAHVRIRNSIALKPERATGVPQGHRRVYIEAETLGLIRGEGDAPPISTTRRLTRAASCPSSRRMR